MSVKRITVAEAPTPVAPYSHAVAFNGTLYVSGQIPTVGKTGNIVEGGIREQVRESLTNLKVVLDGAGSGIDMVMKCNVYLKDMNDFNDMNDVYGEFFAEHKPARTAVQVARLPRDVMVEIECVAALKA
ncbi:endoribonuclease L-PSP [Dacryopinax primogenitus]|uniref:Endoribonuclease L-PSP n=1 Tax=Dacryopinax primogenitus (strain DJM 731) TaxID=1858805 RepID=M5FXK4_DACPD|nr:endoribonuclease L-PSP [Dacryopinax primogenitus]EJU02751.1 endoribonuclease L-PSP [Dacryopinax primogenitus]